MFLDSKEKAFLFAKTALDKKAKDVIILDMRKLLKVTDYFVICSGENKRQIKAIANETKDKIDKKDNFFLGREGMDSSGWVLMDFGNVIGHIFIPETRNFYGLESLWADAPFIEL